MVNDEHETSRWSDWSRWGYWAYWLFVLVLGPLAADGIFALAGGTADTDRGPTWVLLPAIAAVITPLVAAPWTRGKPRSRLALFGFIAATLGALLSVAWAIALLVVLVVIACHGSGGQCLG
jgi:hypothetical protein